MFEDDVLLDHPGMNILHFHSVLRQDEARLASTFTKWGVGVVDDEGWQVAQELFETVMSGKQTRLWPYVSQARDRGFEYNMEMALDRGLEENVEYFAHTDANGAKMTEAELRTVEEQYVLHKVCVVVGEPMLLVVTDDAMWATFGDGARAYNNMVAIPTEIRRGALGAVSVRVTCPDGPVGFNVLEVPMVTRMVKVNSPRKFADAEGDLVPVRNLSFKMLTHRTIASTQGETIEGEIEVMGSEASYPGVLYVGLTRGTKMNKIKLSRMTRAQLTRKLQPSSKVLVLLAAIGREVPVRKLQQAIDEILRSEAIWASQA